MIRRYAILDPTSFEPTGRTVLLDLDDPRASRVVLAADLGSSVAAARSIDEGRVHEAGTLAAEAAGEFADGEARRRRTRFPAPHGSAAAGPVRGSGYDWRAGSTQVGPPTRPPRR